MEAPTVLELRPHDDLASVCNRLDLVDEGRVVLLLPWDLRFLSRELDFDLLKREAKRRQLELAVVAADPRRRRMAHGCGFPAFASVEGAQAADAWDGRASGVPEPPPRDWWEEEIDLRPRPARRPSPWVERAGRGIRVGAFILAILALVGGAYVVVPSAEVTIVPVGETFTAIVPVSVDPERESIGRGREDGLGGIVPARRVGLEIEGSTEVETSGTANVAAGRATGEVSFTNLLAQSYVVPAGTIVRTSSTSYPIRFRTTADVTVPAAGQATAPIEALDERTGNVGAFRINQVEGVAASAVRVINPEPTTGAEPEEIPVVVHADYDRVRERLTHQLIDRAYGELHSLLKPTEFLPRQSLRVEAVPKKAYSHLIGEQADRLGLNMRLLVSGQAVSVDDVEEIARGALSQRLPSGYRLVDTHYELGEVAEEDIGPGWFTFFVTARGYGAAALETGEAVDLIRGRRVADARERLHRALPLAEDPRLAIWPEWPQPLGWLERVPLLPLRISVQVVPQARTTSRSR